MKNKFIEAFVYLSCFLSVAQASDQFELQTTHQALLRHDFKFVTDLFSQKADDIHWMQKTVSTQNAQGCTVLHFMASQPSYAESILSLWGLIRSYDLSVNSQDQAGLTPLHVAVRYGFDQFASALIEAGANPQIPDMKGNMPLDSVFLQSDITLISSLSLSLKKTTGKNDKNALGLALFHNRMDVFKNLLTLFIQKDKREARAAVEHKDYQKNTVLHTLAKFTGLSFDRELVESLLGLSPNTLNICNSYGWSPLYTACLYQNLPLIQHLLQQGAKANQGEHKGNTPLHLSILMLPGNHPSAIEIIQTLSLQTDVLLVNDTGVTPRDLLLYVWAQNSISNEVKRAVDTTLLEKIEQTTEQLRLPVYEKQRVFHNTFSSLVRTYFETRRQEICGELPPQKNMVCFSNAVSLVGNVLSFSGASAISAVVSTVASKVEDQLYLKDLHSAVKGLDGLERMRYEVEKLSYTVMRRYENEIQERLGGIGHQGIIQFANYAANRVKKYLTRGLYRTDQTFTAQMMHNLLHMPPIVNTFWHRLKMRTIGETYLEPTSAHLTARYLLTHPPLQQESIKPDEQESL